MYVTISIDNRYQCFLPLKRIGWSLHTIVALGLLTQPRKESLAETNSVTHIAVTGLESGPYLSRWVRSNLKVSVASDRGTEKGIRREY